MRPVRQKQRNIYKVAVDVEVFHTEPENDFFSPSMENVIFLTKQV
jgi:hypothetical protein